MASDGFSGLTLAGGGGYSVGFGPFGSYSGTLGGYVTAFGGGQNNGVGVYGSLQTDRFSALRFRHRHPGGAVLSGNAEPRANPRRRPESACAIGPAGGSDAAWAHQRPGRSHRRWDPDHQRRQIYGSGGLLHVRRAGNDSLPAFTDPLGPTPTNDGFNPTNDGSSSSYPTSVTTNDGSSSSYPTNVGSYPGSFGGGYGGYGGGGYYPLVLALTGKGLNK